VSGGPARCLRHAHDVRAGPLKGRVVGVGRGCRAATHPELDADALDVAGASRESLLEFEGHPEPYVPEAGPFEGQARQGRALTSTSTPAGPPP
jgi:hypothetical protein